MTNAPSARRTIRAQTIATRFRTVLDPSGAVVDPDDSISRHIAGGAPAVAAFVDKLNDFPSFAADGLALTPGDVRGAKTIGDLLNAIGNWYRDNGWKITI
jgi:hypothetical protein